MFAEGEMPERECARNEQSEDSQDWAAAKWQSSGKATSVREPMAVDEEAKETAVDATNVTDEKEDGHEEKAKPAWADVPADEPM